MSRLPLPQVRTLLCASERGQVNATTRTPHQVSGSAWLEHCQGQRQLSQTAQCDYCCVLHRLHTVILGMQHRCVRRALGVFRVGGFLARSIGPPLLLLHGSDTTGRVTTAKAPAIDSCAGDVIDLTAALLAVPPEQRPIRHNPAINPTAVQQGLDFGAHTRWLLQASAPFLKDCRATVRSLPHQFIS